MKKDSGDKNSHIWLLGDSNPRNWDTVLETPFDPRHPARHSIWTPVLEAVQDRVFRAGRIRVDSTSFYTRNAIEAPKTKPLPQAIEWDGQTERETREFRKTVRQFSPKILLSFGAFAFEFARRALNQGPRRNYGYWSTRRLGEEFRERIDEFDVNQVNLLPLLHVSIARGRFMQSHEHFCGQRGANYFEFVGDHLAQVLLAHRDGLSIWIE